MKLSAKLMFLTAVFVSISSITLASVAFAEHENERYVIEDDKILDNETGNFIYSPVEVDDEGNVIELSLEEFVKDLNEGEENLEAFEEEISLNVNKTSITDDDISPYSMYETYDEYSTSSNVVLGTHWVSEFQVCPSNPSGGCSIEAERQVTTSEEFGVSYSAHWSVVRGGASFTWNSSESSSVTHVISQPAGTEVRMMYQPRYNSTTGEATRYRASSGEVVYSDVGTSYSPSPGSGVYFLEDRSGSVVD